MVKRVKIRETTKRTSTGEELPKEYDDVDDSYDDDSKETIIYRLTDNRDEFIFELSKYSPEIITFNDAEAIIDMDSENPMFDRLFRSVMNQIYMACESSNTNIRIDVNREFLELFLRVLNGLGLGLDVNSILSGAQVAPQSPVALGQGVAPRTPEQASQGSVPPSAATTQAADTPYSTQAQSQSQALSPGAAAEITASSAATSRDIGIEREEGESDEESLDGGKPRKPKHTKRRKYKKQQRNTRRGKQNKRKKSTRKVKNIKKSKTYKHK